MSFKGVLIDFGDTLAYRDEAKNREYEAALASTLKRYGYERPMETVSSVLADIYRNSTKGELETLHEFWGLVLNRLMIPERPELLDAIQNVRDSYAASITKLYDGVAGTLGILRERYRLALVSNCAVGADDLIRALGIADFFGCIILSYQVGVRKPDRRIYLEALRCLRLEAEDCVFAADEISDLEGAREIGLKTILVRQGNSTFQDARDVNFKPDFQISRISEVTNIL